MSYDYLYINVCYFWVPEDIIYLKSTLLHDVIKVLIFSLPVTADLGQRAFVGKVNADKNSPPNYIETLEQSLADTEW